MFHFESRFQDDPIDWIAELIFKLVCLAVVFFVVLAICRITADNNSGAPKDSQTSENIIFQQPVVAQEVESWLIESDDSRLVNDLMTGPIGSADCTFVETSDNMTCWYDNYQGERAYAEFDVRDRPNWKLLRNWQ